MTIIGQPVLKFVAINCSVEEGEQSFKALCEHSYKERLEQYSGLVCFRWK